MQLVQFPRLGPRGHCSPKGPAIGLVVCFIVSLGGFGLLSCDTCLRGNIFLPAPCGCVKLFGELVEGEGQEMGDLLIISLSLGSCCYGKDQYILFFVYTDPNFDSERLVMRVMMNLE